MNGARTLGRAGLVACSSLALAALAARFAHADEPPTTGAPLATPSASTSAPAVSSSASAEPPLSASVAPVEPLPTTRAPDPLPPPRSARDPHPTPEAITAAVAPLEEAKPEPKSPIQWNPRWRQVAVWEYVAAGAFALGAISSTAIPGVPRWVAPNQLDETVRDALRADTPRGRSDAGHISDLMLTLLVNHRLVDDLFVTWWAYGAGSVALQMTLIDIETLAFSAGVNSLIAGAVGRQRPSVIDGCKTADERDTSDCTSSDRYRSFFSGHTTAAFTLAGLTCIHHANVPLYGHPLADALACLGGMAAATTTGAMRIVADRHYITDVLVGAAFGTAAGVTLPWLLHYRGGADVVLEKGHESRVERPPLIQSSFSVGPGGAYWVGAF